MDSTKHRLKAVFPIWVWESLVIEGGLTVGLFYSILCKGLEYLPSSEKSMVVMINDDIKEKKKMKDGNIT